MKRKFQIKLKIKLKEKTKDFLSLFLASVLWLTFVATSAMAVCNAIVIKSAEDYVVSFDEAVDMEDVDCIIVLGAGVNPDGSMSYVLSRRVWMGAELYLAKASQRLLLSGDHSREDYNEVGAMKDYMLSRDIPSSVVFTDHAGLDTYDTMYRAKEVFKAKKVIIVTQQFHISRAVFIARSLGLDAYGVCCDPEKRYFNLMTDIREFCARPKYLLDSVIKPKPKYLGEAIPIWGEASASDG